MKFLLTLLLMISATAFAAKKTTEITLTDDNVISLKSAFDHESVGQLIEEASKLDSRLPSGQPIYLFLRTPGGSIQAGLELFEYLKGLNRPVHTITLFAASMGFQTVQQLGKRYILRNGVLMSHRARGGMQGEFGGGTAQMDTRYGLWLRRVQSLDQDTVKRTNGKQTLKSYQSAYANELWLNGEEAVAQGYADELVTLKCDSSLDGKVEKVTEQSLFFSVDLLVPKCPLKTRPVGTNTNIVTNKGPMTLEVFIAKNPTFKKCADIEKENTEDRYNEVKKEVVCALDEELSVAKINQQVRAMADFLTQDLTAKVIRN